MLEFARIKQVHNIKQVVFLQSDLMVGLRFDKVVDFLRVTQVPSLRGYHCGDRSCFDGRAAVVVT